MKYVFIGPCAALALAAACTTSSPAPTGGESSPLAGQAVADPTCRWSSAPSNPDAFPLAVEFLEREARGLLLQGGPWLSSALLCPGRDGPSSQYFVVTGHELASKSSSPEKTEFDVAYQVEGEIVPVTDARGSRLAFVPQTERKTVPLALWHTAAGWRVQGPLVARGLYVQAGAALKAAGARLSAKDRAALSALSGSR